MEFPTTVSLCPVSASPERSLGIHLDLHRSSRPSPSVQAALAPTRDLAHIGLVLDPSRASTYDPISSLIVVSA
jgi:hypothetical protein